MLLPIENTNNSLNNDVTHSINLNLLNYKTVTTSLNNHYRLHDIIRSKQHRIKYYKTTNSFLLNKSNIIHYWQLYFKITIHIFYHFTNK